MKISRRTLFAGLSGAVLGGTAVAGAGLVLGPGRRRSSAGEKSVVSIREEGERRIITANGLPGHVVGDFPNAHNPFGIRPQDHHFEMPLKPTVADQITPLKMWRFGIAINGVPFDPSSAFWNGDASSGWQFEVLSPAGSVALGIDANRAHAHIGGVYHYHGLPTGLLWVLSHRDPDRPMHMLGYAADGFPIYGPEAMAVSEDLQSGPRRLRSSYCVRTGHRPDGPKGRFDGTFVEDFEYIPGRGDLDECNGRTGPTPEFPDGTYYYVLTDEFPFIPRFYRGTPSESFRYGPPPGVSAPLPPELKKYQAVG